MQAPYEASLMEVESREKKKKRKRERKRKKKHPRRVMCATNVSLNTAIRT